MGLWARWPVAIAPGMGLNAYFAYGLVLGQQFSWQQALTAVFIASVLFLLFSLSPLRSWLIGAIPDSLRLGITAGIGLFLAMIGLQGMGLVVDDPDTLLRLGNLGSPAVLLSLAGLLVMAGLAARGVIRHAPAGGEDVEKRQLDKAIAASLSNQGPSKRAKQGEAEVVDLTQ